MPDEPQTDEQSTDDEQNDSAPGPKTSKKRRSGAVAVDPEPETTPEPEPEPVKAAEHKIKFMGSADQRILPAGDTASGTLPPLPMDLVFERSNHWIIDSADPAYAAVPAVWWDHLAENEIGFSDVTGLSPVPLNTHQRTFLGMVQRGEKPRSAAPGVGDLPVSSR